MALAEPFDKLWALPEYRQFSAEEAFSVRMIEMARSRNAKRVLSVGCGDGQGLRRLLEAGFDAFGVDISPVALGHCLDLAPRVKCLDFLSVKEPLFGEIDYLFAVDVLQLIAPADLDAFFTAVRAQNPKNFCFITNLNKDPVGPFALGKNLHLCRRSGGWWQQLVGEYLNVQKTAMHREGPFAFHLISGIRGASAAVPAYKSAMQGESEQQKSKRYRRNFEALTRQSGLPDLEGFLGSPDADYNVAGLTVRFSEKGEPAGILNVGGSGLAIDDAMRPRVEARDWARAIGVRSDDTLVLMVGLGFGYAAEELLRLLSPKAHLVVVEPYSALLRAALEHRDLTGLFVDSRFHLITSVDESVLKDKITEIVLKNPEICASRPVTRMAYATLLGDQAVALAHAATVRYFAGMANKHTTETECVVWSEQLLRNLAWSVEHPGMEAFDGVKNLPAAVVVGAGPSLEGSIEFIKSVQDHMPVIAVDVAIPRLRAAGIDPHIAVVMDRSKICFERVQSIDPKKTGLVLFSQVYPGFAEQDALFKVINIEEIVCKMLAPAAHRKTCEHMAFVGGSAARVACALGVETLYLCGMDFAFAPDGTTHCRGAHSRNDGQENPEDIKDEWLPVPGYAEPKLRTNRLFRIYLDQFCDFVRQTPRVRFVPVTTGGARIGDLERLLPGEAAKACAAHPAFDWREQLRAQVLAARLRLNVPEQLALLREHARTILNFRTRLNAAADRRALICVLDDLVRHDCHYLVEWIFVEAYYSLFSKADLQDKHLELVRERLNKLAPALQALTACESACVTA